ncbi:MAG: DNA polymerase III subunit delta [Arcanobacterium sp.]|nr:DNA polymerase III subunit delta [Arcanobacterium sp.]
MATRTKLTPAPIVLIQSGEPVFGDRAVQSLKAQILKVDPNTEITEIDAARYIEHSLETLASPSLFGESRAILIPNLEQLNTALADELFAYLQQPEPDVCVILRHNGGLKGKKILDAVKKAGFPSEKIEEVKRPADKVRLVKEEVAAQKRAITGDAVNALVAALGSDLRELLAAINQLMNDVEGQITEDAVNTYFSGRIEATGFNVADAVVVGDVGRGIELARHALATGVSAVQIISALALKLRQMATVLGQRSSQIDYEVRVDDWVARQAKAALRGWSAQGLAKAIQEVAVADRDVKGGSLDKEYAIERVILEIGRARQIQ